MSYASGYLKYHALPLYKSLIILKAFASSEVRGFAGRFLPAID